jgi:hypothetical protein
MAKTKSRRENGEGSIFYRKDKDLWTVEVTVGYNIDGTKKKKTIYSKSRDELLTKFFVKTHSKVGNLDNVKVTTSLQPV